MKTVLSRALAAVVVAGLPLGVAAADVPEALDRVPASTPVVISIGNVNAFFTQAEAITTALQQQEAQMGVQMAKMMLSMPGINAEGSAAIAMTSIENLEEQKEPPMVAIIPVTDYAAMVANFGGTGEGLEALDFEGNTVYIRDLGDGFAALGPMEDVLANFDASAGNTDDHNTFMGETGSRMSDDNAVLIIANMDNLREPMLEGWEEASENMGQMMAMGGAQADQMAGQMEMMDALVRGFARDADRALMGVSGGEYGFSFEIGANFKEGTELANTFADAGDAGSMLGKLPGGPYLFAYAMDYSAPGIKDMLAKIGEMGGEEAGGMAGLNPMDFLDNATGLAQVMGVSPGGLMGGGLLTNMSAVFTVDDADGLVSAFGEQIGEANDQVVNGISMTTSYSAEAETIGGADAHRWSIQMLPDMSQPGAMQMQMMMPMLFGPSGGPAGYIAAADDSSVVVTYSTKSQNVENAINAARNGGALAADQLLMQQAERLHSEPFMVAYVDGGSILNTVLPTVAMFMGPVNVDIPEHVTPLGLSAQANGGGMSFRAVVPTDLIEVSKQTAAAFEGMAGGGMGDGQEAPPSF
ncbi:MAG: hypothetical protein ACIARQ_14030 [Phycisphaerales bacterium JB061]